MIKRFIAKRPFEMASPEIHADGLNRYKMREGHPDMGQAKPTYGY